MGHPTVKDKEDDLYVRNIATNTLNKHLQIADNGWSSKFYIMLWANNMFPTNRHLSKRYSRQGNWRGI
jgi:hypothetical protein